MNLWWLSPNVRRDLIDFSEYIRRAPDSGLTRSANEQAIYTLTHFVPPSRRASQPFCQWREVHRTICFHMRASSAKRSFLSKYSNNTPRFVRSVDRAAASVTVQKVPRQGRLPSCSSHTPEHISRCGRLDVITYCAATDKPSKSLWKHKLIKFEPSKTKILHENINLCCIVCSKEKSSSLAASAVRMNNSKHQSVELLASARHSQTGVTSASDVIEQLKCQKS